ncbi:cell division cycle-associated protein 7-like [Adelges cooleyi]|uniref:cell division cycle-associated protein 7-like n=1 Tax=Adelges cooleyi TaxID=133065 RepID=UPI00217F7A0C|nr:cell division cycle-associated protein 7-like [Adelges cooleyi]
MAVAIALKSKNNEELSEYERQRLENIMEMQEQFSDLFDEVKRSAQDLAATAAAPLSEGSFSNRKRTRNAQGWRRPVKVASKISNTPERVRCVRRSARIRQDNKKGTNYNEESDDEDGQKKKRHGTIRVMFPFFKKSENKERDEEYYNSLADSDFIVSGEEFDYNDDEPRSKRRRNNSSATVPRLPASQVTQEMLDNITYSSCGKQYNADRGTTCHQCRQKTLDQKSYCRYKGCRGVRGMFCGFCLGKRYGEDVAEVLLNPKWACPPCRGYCNCSICRRRKGKEPTGQLATQASASGYKSVRHMLSNIEGEAASKELSSDSENEDDKSNDEEEVNDKNTEDTLNTKKDSIGENNDNIIKKPTMTETTIDETDDYKSNKEQTNEEGIVKNYSEDKEIEIKCDDKENLDLCNTNVLSVSEKQITEIDNEKSLKLSEENETESDGVQNKKGNQEALLDQLYQQLFVKA